MKWLCWCAVVVLCACVSSGSEVTDTAKNPDNNQWSWQLPPSFPTPQVAADNPMTEAKFQLGRHLFYDKRLSGNGQQACASCHQQALLFSDGREVSTGSTGEKTLRNAPSLINVAYHPTFNWASPTITSLEQQMQTPLFSTAPVELGINDANRAEVLTRFKSDNTYIQLFAAAFPNDTDAIGFNNIIKAIATFERALLSGSSNYERYLNNQYSLSAPEARGLQLFLGEKAECFHCHGQPNFNDQFTFVGVKTVLTNFHNTGLYNIGGTGAFPSGNQGLFETSGKATDRGKFRAPSLFNVALTAPYMHDGSIATLEEVIDFYAAGGRNITTGPYAGDGRKNPNKSSLTVGIALTDQEKADLVAFLKTLSDETLKTNARFSKPSAP